MLLLPPLLLLPELLLRVTGLRCYHLLLHSRQNLLC